MSRLNAMQNSQARRLCAAVMRVAVCVSIAGGTFMLDTSMRSPVPMMPIAEAVDCARRLVAGGDHLPAGHEVDEDERYPEQLVENHLKKWGPWCTYNVAKNETTSSTYITGGQLAQTVNLRPDLITLTVGGENKTIVKLVTDCFNKVKDHDFTEATTCAATILGNSSLWTELTSNLTTTLQQYRVLMAGRPNLVVGVTGYPNPYPKSLEAAAKIVQLCTPLVDTIPTCTTRWAQLPPALELIDQVIKKLNTTIQDAVSPFAIGSGGRFVYVNVYDKLRDHCMKMEVEIKTKVAHPEQNSVHDHNSPKVNFGCSDPWFVEGDDGSKNPTYLLPASLGVLVQQSQTTSGMGIHPNLDGHKCIAQLIWEADTLHPGVTPLKWLLGVPEAPESNICP